MQLKTVGQSLNALNSIQNILNDTSLVGARLNIALSSSLNGYSIETVKAAIAQGTFTAEQIKAILTAKGLTDAEIQEVITTNALTASQTGATASTFGLGTAFKGLGLSIKTATKSMLAWMATNPVGWITAVVSAIGASIYGVVKLHDALTVSLEEQKEKLQETKEAYENVKNELQEVETELQNTQNKVEELENTPNLSWVEQEELDRLREVTKELELQKQLKQDARLESAQDLYKENEKTFSKEFKSSYGNTSIADLKERLAYGHIGMGQLDYDNITDIVTALQYINEEKAKLTDESEIAEYEDFINDLTNLIKSNGQEYLSSLSEYKQNILEIASIRDLTEDEQAFYDYLSSMQKAIYEYYSPATWNNLEFDSIFDTADIEKTKDELVSMYKSGELSSAEMLEQFPKLNEAIKQSEMITGESSDVYKEFFNEIAALAEKQADVVNETLNAPNIPSTITSSIQQIASQLEPQFAELGEAYKDIFTSDGFTLENIDNSMLESLRKSFAEIEEEIGVTFDATQLESFFSVLSDGNSTAEEVQNTFNDIATSYLYSTDVLESLNTATIGSITKQLEALGVTNASEVATEALAIKEEYLAFARREHIDDTGKLISVTQDLADATADDINVLIEEQDALEGEGIALDETTQKIIAYWMQKQAANGQLSTVGDIQQLSALCEALGVSSKALRNYIYFKKLASMTDVYDADTLSIYADNAEKYMSQAQDDMRSLYSELGGVNIGFDVPDTSSSASKSAKDTTETFDWIERAIENVESEIDKLDKVATSAYSSFAEKNQALADQIHKVNEEIQLQQQAYQGYMDKANSVGLSDEYKQLVQTGDISIEDITDEDLQEAISDYQKWYEAAQDTQDKINDLYEQSKDLHVSAYENCASELEQLRESQAISEREYLDRMNTLWEFYYKNQISLANQAKEAKLELLDEEKEYLEAVANAAIDILGEQVDDLKDKQEAEVAALEAKKKPLQDQLDMLEKQKDLEDRLLALQKAQYELKRAESQRDKLVYVDGQMVYRADENAVRDAKDAVDDAEYDVIKGDIQDRIDAYDEEINKVNERYETEIDNLERLENEWQKALALQERAVNAVNFESMFGEGSISNLLAGDLSMVNTWKQTYLDTLGEIDIVSNGAIGEITAKYAELAGLNLTNVTEQAKTVVSQFDALNEAVGNVNSAIGAVSGESSDNGQPEMESGSKKEKASASLVGAMEEAYDVASEVLPNEAEMFDTITEAAQGATDAINAMKAAIESLNGMSVGGAVISSAHADGTVGTAFAEGTGNHSGLPHDEKNALRSEYGQPELTVYPNGTTELTTSPVMSDLPKGTVIYNEEQTKKIMDNKVSAKGNAHADGTNDEGWFTTPDVMRLRPLQPGDEMYDMIQKFDTYMKSIDNNIEKLAPNTMYEQNRQMHDIVNQINNSNVVNNNQPAFTINGGINVTCPGVNSKEVMSQVSTALEKEFSGLALAAYQRANITR